MPPVRLTPFCRIETSTDAEAAQLSCYGAPGCAMKGTFYFQVKIRLNCRLQGKVVRLADFVHLVAAVAMLQAVTVRDAIAARKLLRYPDDDAFAAATATCAKAWLAVCRSL